MSALSADKLGKWLAIGGAVAVVAVVAMSIVQMGTPMAQRRMRIDAGRVGDLARIASVINLWQDARGTLPPDLATLARRPGADLPIVDRVTGVPYEYARVDATHYRLCAVFTTDTAHGRVDEWPASGPDWDHGAGRHCFTRKAEK
jgi:hypothetical protein